MSVFELATCIDKFEALPGFITEYHSPENFIQAWKSLCGSLEAKKSKEIIYLWKTEKPVTRLKGESNIIYIGKTINSIYTRHYKYAEIEAKGERNRPRYEHLLTHFGKISFHIARHTKFDADIKMAERKILEAYFNEHLEYPPLNRMGK